MHFYVFGYGSLIAEPERADRVSHRQLASLHGYRRLFNKRSPGRGCPADEAFAAFDAPPGFRMGSRLHSLAVGLEEDPADSVAGVALAYPTDLEREVLAETDRREGYDPDRDRALLGYLRLRVSVQRPGLGDSVTAWTWVSNPRGRYHVDFDLEERARVLISATPRPGTPTASDGRGHGVTYLERLREGLRRMGRVEEHLEIQAAAVHGYPGPWCDLLSQRRKTTE